MIRDRNTYIKQVFYFDPRDAVKDVAALIEGSLTLDFLRTAVDNAHKKDENKYGEDIYKKLYKEE